MTADPPGNGRPLSRITEIVLWLAAVVLSVGGFVAVHHTASRPFKATLTDPLALPKEVPNAAKNPVVPLPSTTTSTTEPAR